VVALSQASCAPNYSHEIACLLTVREPHYSDYHSNTFTEYDFTWCWRMIVIQSDITASITKLQQHCGLWCGFVTGSWMCSVGLLCKALLLDC